MSSGTPYIGSKISLISKAEIRYEGVLYDVNSKEATVTLSKVKSYGTETRRAVKHIPPRNEVYEYIIFRGSDIKDLSVSEMGNRDEEPHLDPAIVSAQTAPPPVTSTRSDPSSNLRGNTTTMAHSSGGGSSSSSILPTPPHPVQPAGYTQFPPPGMGQYNPFGSMPYFGRAPPPPQMMMNLPMQHAQMNQQPLSQTPPTHISTISSAMNSSPQAGTTTNPPQSLPNPTQGTPKVTLPTFGMNPGTSQDTTTPIRPGNTVQPFSAPPQVHVPKSQPQDNPSISTDTSQPHPSPPQTNDGTSRHEKTKNDKKPSSISPTSSNEELKRKPPRRGGRKDGQKYANYTPRGSNVGNSYRGGQRGGGYRSSGWNRPTGNNGGSSYPTPNRPPGGYPTPNRPPGSYPTPNRPPPTQSNSSSQAQPLKYTKDFDFESANALFSKDQLEEEMKSKLRISDDQVKDGEDVMEDSESHEQEELEEGEMEREDEEQGNTEGFYNKSKSFFDSISCEATQSNSSRRSNRSQEMALNTETFGVANSRNYNNRSRGNSGRGYNPRYRGGRGRYNQYNGYNSYRGGYHQGRGDKGYYRGRSRSGTRDNESYGRNQDS